MASKITIPVEIKLNQDALNSLRSNLDVIIKDTNGKFSEQQKTQATKLINTIASLSSKVGQALSVDEITKEQLDNFKSTFSYVSKESKKLGHEINTALAAQGEKILSEDDLARLNKADTKIELAKKKLQELSQIPLEAKTFQDVLPTGMTRAQFKMPTTTSLKTAEARFEKYDRDLEAYDKLISSGKKLNDEQQNEYKWLTENKSARDLAKKAVQDQIATEDAQYKALKNAEKDVTTVEKERDNVLKQLMATATAEQRTVIEGLIREGKQIDENNKKLTFKEQLSKLGGDLNIFGGFIEGIKNNFTNFVQGIASGVIIINTVKRVFNDTIKTIRELDKAFNDIAMVTTYTTNEVWKMKDAFVGIADTTGLALTEVTKIAGEFFRQGRSYSEVLKLTEAAGIAAKVAGISATESVDYLTSAINGYKLSADQALAVSDKFAALAAASATDYEELAIALSKVAAQAYSAGVNMDNMMGFIAKALEVTREAPENIGTAFKTIFARMQELKDFGKTLEDGMDLNRVDKALATIGISLTNQENELRNLDDVLIDVGNKWTTLSKNQKAYITTALAGTRQQTRLLAVFDDFDRTMELTEVSANSLGATFAQQEKYYSSIAYAQNQLTVAWQNFISSLGSSGAFIAFYNILSGLVGALNDIVATFKDFGGVLLLITTIMIGFTLAQKLQNKSILDEAKAIFIANNARKADFKTRLATFLQSIAQTGVNTTEAFSWKALAASIGGATKAMWKFLTTTPTGWAILAVVAVASIAMAFQAASKKNKEFVESMRKSQAEIFNFRKKADDLEGLLDKYNEIENSVNRTKEDLAKQTEYVQQMQDLLGEEGNAIDLTGKFNPKVVQDQIKKLREDANTAFADSIKKSTDAYGTIQNAYVNTSDTIIRQQLLIQKAIQDGTVESYSAFLDMESDKRSELLATKQLELDAIQFIGKEITTMNSSGESTMTIVDPDKLKEAKGYLASLFAQDFSNSPLSNQIQQLTDLKFDKWDQGIKDALAASSPEIQNIISLMDKLGVSSTEALQNIIDNSDLTSQQIIKLNTVLEKTNLTTDQQSDLFRQLTAEGGNTFATLRVFAEQYNLNLFDTLDLTQQLRDAMNETSMIDLGNQLKSLQSVSDNIAKVNAMISGEQDYDLAFMNEMINLYPEIGSAIAQNAQVSEQTTKNIMFNDKQAFLNKVDLQIEELQSQYDINEIKIQALEKMLTNEDDLNKAMALGKIDLEKSTDGEMYAAYLQYLKDKAIADATYEQQKRIKQIENNADLTDAQKNAAINSVLKITADTSAFDKLITDSQIASGSYTTFAERIKGQVAALKTSNDTIKAQISNLNFLKNNIDKVTKATQASTKAAQDYKAALDELYNLEQQLKVVENELANLKFAEEHTKSGEEYVKTIYSINAALEAQNNILENTIDAQKREQQAIFNSLGTLQQYVTVRNGRMTISNMAAYLKLSDENQKILDESANSYNDLTDSINDNNQSIQENTAALEENLQKIEDKTVEFYDTIKEAVLAEEEAKQKALLDGLEEERKLLDKRKAMYEEAFSETDYTNKLKETSDARAEIIKKLTALEGATDSASVKKREDLLKQKADLDKEYNSTATQYNRDALYQSIDDTGKAIDEKQTQYEKEYEDRINSTIWVEDQIQSIINKGLDSTIQYLKDNLPEYQDAWSMSKDNIVNDWTFLYGVVDTTVDKIQSKIPDFTAMINALQAAAAEVQSIQDNLAPATSVTPVVYQTPPVTPKVTKTVDTTTSLRALTGEGGLAAKLEQTAPSTKVATAPTKATTISSQAPEVYSGVKTTTTTNSAQVAAIQKSTAIARSAQVVASKSNIKPFATGGLATGTGPAWLDGTINQPERVLSPIQTELFDKMVQSLEIMSKGGSTALAGINIANVGIEVGGLETDQQFSNAGAAFAKELKAAIKERGLSINKKR